MSNVQKQPTSIQVPFCLMKVVHNDNGDILQKRK
jgi:hypothetical protein